MDERHSPNRQCGHHNMRFVGAGEQRGLPIFDTQLLDYDCGDYSVQSC